MTRPGGLPLEQVTGSTANYLFHDQLGSTRLLTDASGNKVGSYTYNAYGTVASHSRPVTTPFGYAGQYTDSDSLSLDMAALTILQFLKNSW